MNKKDISISKINYIIKKEVNIDVKKVLSSGEGYNNTPQIKRATLLLIDSIKKDLIPNIEINEDYNENNVLNELTNLFVIGLIDVSPLDFEGDEPLDVNELIETSSLYIYNHIQKQSIKGISFYL